LGSSVIIPLYRPYSPANTSQRIFKLFTFSLFNRAQTCSCYHCGEQVAVRSVVKMLFDGKQRDLCCHGCEAVLLMVEANGLTSDYLSEKNNAVPITP